MSVLVGVSSNEKFEMVFSDHKLAPLPLGLVFPPQEILNPPLQLITDSINWLKVLRLCTTQASKNIINTTFIASEGRINEILWKCRAISKTIVAWVKSCKPTNLISFRTTTNQLVFQRVIFSNRKNWRIWHSSLCPHPLYFPMLPGNYFSDC